MQKAQLLFSERIARARLMRRVENHLNMRILRRLPIVLILSIFATFLAPIVVPASAAEEPTVESVITDQEPEAGQGPGQDSEA
ncbi:hypothetical protein K0U00_10030, partial [Paenibacillus sepulcri]|nr:hypothetical protein [Paenibacillus sepulcri]